ncbi:hypothetical protein [Streptomyces sp. NPDC001100]
MAVRLLSAAAAREKSAAGGFVGQLAHGQRLKLEELLAGQVCGVVRLWDRGWAA